MQERDPSPATLVAPAGDSPPHLSIAVPDADAATAQAYDRGAEVLAGPYDAPFMRIAVLRDPRGAVVTVSEYVPSGEGRAA